MTLTQLLPSLRRSIPDPLTPDLWPEYTTASTTDVFVAGVSLLRLVDICQTPCLHTAAAVIPGTHGRPSLTDRATAIVVSITSVTFTSTGTLCIRVDADLDSVRPILAEARMIGRASTAHATAAVLVLKDAEGDDPGVVELLTSGLPCDIRVGDLLALPCRGELALRGIRRTQKEAAVDAALTIPAM
ncbi:MAG: hypothetical protein JWQ64_1861 [Subtercola sp.]|nr:hypothetical protein [Subtercola sp.]